MAAPTIFPVRYRATRLAVEGRDRRKVVGDGAAAGSPQYVPKESQRRRTTAVHRIATHGKMIATVPHFVGPGHERKCEGLANLAPKRT